MGDMRSVLYAAYRTDSSNALRIFATLVGSDRDFVLGKFVHKNIQPISLIRHQYKAIKTLSTMLL